MTRPTTRRFAAGFCLVLVAASSLRAADPPTPQAKPAPAPLSNTTLAERQLRITWAAGGGGGATAPDVATALTRLMAPDVAGKIGQELLGIPAAEALSTIRQAEQVSRSGSAEAYLSVRLDPAKHAKARPAAKEFADELVTRFTNLLIEDRLSQELPREQLAREQLASATDDYESAARQLRELSAKMGGRSPEGVRAAMAKLDDEAQRLELELAGLHARQRAVEEWIDRTTKKAVEQAKADPVIAELEKAVAAQQKLVDLMTRQAESGVASAASVVEAEAKLAEARVQLLDRKQGAASDRGGAGDPLSALNRELQTLSIDVVDRSARLEFIKKRTEPLQKASESAFQFERLNAECNALRQELDRAREARREAERAVQAAPRRDRVSVVQSTNQTSEKPQGSTRPE